jgi:hypothetical protein
VVALMMWALMMIGLYEMLEAVRRWWRRLRGDRGYD